MNREPGIRPPWVHTEEEDANLRLVAASVPEVALLYVTETGVIKSTLDATHPVRTLFSRTGFHEFTTQQQGQANKVLRRAVLVGNNEIAEGTVSLYRPKSKSGDPRLWSRLIGDHVSGGSVVALFVHGESLCFVDLSASSLYIANAPAATQFLAGISAESASRVEELVGRLRAIARQGLIMAVGKGDMAVGRTIEHALGIRANSSKGPDYKGIELKSKRGRLVGRPRSNLFAQVPNWELSPLKSSREILEAFGYERAGTLRLNCTMELGRLPNSQGLFLELSSDSSRLLERSINSGTVALWLVESLHGRLLEKHADTLWITAEAQFQDGVEYFRYIKAQHTRAPSVAMFDEQLAAGNITVDHLCKRKAGGGCHERGPLFKIREPYLSTLFPSRAVDYSLLS